MHHSVVLAQGHVQTQSILRLVPAVAMMSLMCLVLYKQDSNVSPSQDLLIQVGCEAVSIIIYT